MAILYTTKIITKQDRQSTYKRNIEARSPNYCYRRKAISITYSECVCVCVFVCV
jgi:hypothetical protein